MKEATMASDSGPYSVKIIMNTATVTALCGSQYYLYGLKAVQSSDHATMPLIWMQTQNYSLNTTLSWRSEYEAYTSTNTTIPPSPGQHVDIGFAAPITAGELLTVTQPSGFGAVTTDGTVNMISILNNTEVPFNCGICEKTPDSEFSPVCATPLYGNGFQLVVPVPKILLLFATMPLPPGTAIETAPSQGLLIDQTSTPECTVNFDINAGWSANAAPYAQVIPARSNLVSLIAVYSQSLASLVTELASRRGEQ